MKQNDNNPQTFCILEQCNGRVCLSKQILKKDADLGNLAYITNSLDIQKPKTYKKL